jgi:hypothetical protein
LTPTLELTLLQKKALSAYQKYVLYQKLVKSAATGTIVDNAPLEDAVSETPKPSSLTQVCAHSLNVLSL